MNNTKPKQEKTKQEKIAALKKEFHNWNNHKTTEVNNLIGLGLDEIKRAILIWCIVSIVRRSEELKIIRATFMKPMIEVLKVIKMGNDI